MKRCVLFMKVYGLAADEDGNKDYAGLKIDFGEFKPGKALDYDQLIKGIKKDTLPKMIGLEKVIKPTDIEIISPEEYQKEFGNE